MKTMIIRKAMIGAIVALGFLPTQLLAQPDIRYHRGVMTGPSMTHTANMNGAKVWNNPGLGTTVGMWREVMYGSIPLQFHGGYRFLPSHAPSSVRVVTVTGETATPSESSPYVLRLHVVNLGIRSGYAMDVGSRWKVVGTLGYDLNLVMNQKKITTDAVTGPRERLNYLPSLSGKRKPYTSVSLHAAARYQLNGKIALQVEPGIRWGLGSFTAPSRSQRTFNRSREFPLTVGIVQRL